jgi:hypothetical protein
LITDFTENAGHAGGWGLAETGGGDDGTQRAGDASTPLFNDHGHLPTTTFPLAWTVATLEPAEFSTHFQAIPFAED